MLFRQNHIDGMTSFPDVGSFNSLSGAWGISSCNDASWKRRQCYEELLMSERKFMRQLLSVVNNYFKPMKVCLFHHRCNISIAASCILTHCIRCIECIIYYYFDHRKTNYPWGRCSIIIQ